MAINEFLDLVFVACYEQSDWSAECVPQNSKICSVRIKNSFNNVHYIHSTQGRGCKL